MPYVGVSTIVPPAPDESFFERSPFERSKSQSNPFLNVDENIDDPFEEGGIWSF